MTSNGAANHGTDLLREVQPRSRVELHIHLDGAVRPSTVLDLARKRAITLPADNVEDLKKYITVEPWCCDLRGFLAAFAYVMPAIEGDVEAIERISYEFCEDSSNSGVLYTEVRYCPHLLTGSTDTEAGLTLSQVVEAIIRGLEHGMKDFNIKVRSILCCMQHRPDWSQDILDLCVKYRDRGVVAIDIAGNEYLVKDGVFHEKHVKVFQDAKKLGINRTVHAGEAKVVSNIISAVDVMGAQRIGHGYTILQDEDAYQRLLKQDMHFEVCLWSSLCTKSVDSKNMAEYPAIRMMKDGFNMSLSTDDPGITGKSLTDEYTMAMDEMGLTRLHIVQSIFNAARSAFLPDEEKTVLIEELKKIHDKDILQHIRFK